MRAAHITIPRLIAFLRQLVATAPAGTQLLIVLDNWPVHSHPDFLVALEPQVSPFPRYTPGNWPPAASAAARRKWSALHLPIQLIPLPSYAAWCHPIEKVWLKLRQELGHLHPWADHLGRLRAALDGWSARYAAPSPDLLHYVGHGPAD